VRGDVGIGGAAGVAVGYEWGRGVVVVVVVFVPAARVGQF